MSDIQSTIHEAFAGQPVLVYGLHPNEPPKLLADFVEQTGLTFPIVADPGSVWQFNFSAGTPYPYPRDVIIDKNGVVRSVKATFDVDETVDLIEQLLAE